MNLPETKTEQQVIINIGDKPRTITFKAVEAYVHPSFLHFRGVAAGNEMFFCRADVELKRIRRLHGQNGDYIHENLMAETLHEAPSKDEEGKLCTVIEVSPSQALYIDFYPLRKQLCEELARLSTISGKMRTVEQVLKTAETTPKIYQQLERFASPELVRIAKAYGVLERLTQQAVEIPVPETPGPEEYAKKNLQQFISDVNTAVSQIETATARNLRPSPPRQR